MSVPLPVGALVRRLSGLPPSVVTGYTHAEMRRGEGIRHFHQIIFHFEGKPTGKTCCIIQLHLNFNLQTEDRTISFRIFW